MYTIERALVWRKSSRSGDGQNCVEAARAPAGIAVRDSKAPEAGMLQLPQASWRTFADRVRAGQHDLRRNA